MAPSAIAPTLGQVINKACQVLSGRLRVGMPGIIQSYDASTQTADVLPAPMPTVFAEDGSEFQEAYPVLPNVPVVFPAGGGYRITFPVKQGDACWLAFADHSIDIWQAQGGQYAPIWLHEHDLSDAVCFPGLHANNAPWADAPTDTLTIGNDKGLTIRIGASTIDLGGGATDFVAMASKVMQALADVRTLFQSWTPAAGDGGLVLKNLATALFGLPPPVPQTWPVSVASTVVKVKG